MLCPIDPKHMLLKSPCMMQIIANPQKKIIRKTRVYLTFLSFLVVSIMVQPSTIQAVMLAVRKDFIYAVPWTSLRRVRHHC